MKIVQITASFSQYGGASNIPLILHKKFLEFGHDSHIFSGVSDVESSAVTTLHKTKLRSIISHLCANDIDFYNSSQIIENTVFKECDVVLCHNLHGWYFNLNTLRQITKLKPLFWTFHDMWPITPHCGHADNYESERKFFECNSKKNYPSLLWDNSAYLISKKIDILTSIDFTIISPSHWLEGLIKKSFLSTKKCVQIYNGIDVSSFNYDKDARSQLLFSQKNKYLLFIATNGLENPVKGGEDVKKIAKALLHTDYKIMVIGDELKRNYGFNNIISVGKITDRNLLTKYYSACDFLLLLSYNENYPLVSLEALACGLPIIAYDTGGIREAFLHKEFGILFKKGDIDSIINNLQKVADTTEHERMSISKEARKAFSDDEMARNYLDLFSA